jgi:hypothetical protein
MKGSAVGFPGVALALTLVAHAQDLATRAAEQPTVSVQPPAATSATDTNIDAGCAALEARMSAKWPDASTRITQATWRPDGTQVALPMFMGPPASLPAHCELTAVMHERVGVDGQRYAIRFRLRLPAQWNERFLFEGGGGTEGELGMAVGMVAAGAPTALTRGYAVVAEDSGHDNAIDSNPARGGQVAFGFDPQARADYGGASLQPVAQAAEAAIEVYYGHNALHSYFMGCSKGGQEGMVFAQRYPGTFDGIIAGAPGFSLPRAALAEAWDTQAFASLIDASNHTPIDLGSLPTTFGDTQFSVARDAILTACDADDGARDGITADFAACTWRRVQAVLEQKICAGGARDSCLTRRQLDVLARVLGGPKDSKGRRLYADWPVDAGIGSPGWRVWKIGAAKGSVPGMSAGFPAINVTTGAPALASIFTTLPTPIDVTPQAGLAYALHFDFDRDAPKVYAVQAPFERSAWTDISARSANLDAFRAHGGKMIVPQGASDPVFSLNDTLAWYQEVNQRTHGAAASFVRVFPVPGMAHCAGGPATDQLDALDALVSWVEKGEAPDRILATAGPSSPWPGRTRPLCPYPKIARYSGTGSIEEAQNFKCQ